ncbi:hypothetical protein AMECASPLE_029684 [Ameca splendens]|uniref:Uncharacterized protein n=1 Tax=Ameca splendens TaxID=208324 RepID=A0ABV0YGY3_9TELE
MQERQSDGVFIRRHRGLHGHVRVHLWSDWDLNSFVLPVGEGGVPSLRVVQVLLWAVLHRDDAVEGLEAAPQLQVDFALDVHEDDAACEADAHHNQLGPEGPLQHACRHRKPTAPVSRAAG